MRIVTEEPDLGRCCVLATDYDGTLARHGRVDAATLAALERARANGCTLLLVTGRELPDLRAVFPPVDRFDGVVAENGALLYWPDTRRVVPLADPPPPRFVRALRERGVHPLSTGRVIVATLRVHEAAVREVIEAFGLDLQLIPNQESLMLLPPGIDKGSGLAAALKELGFSADEVVGIGDAENDIALFGACGRAVAVANALPALKELAHFVTSGECGAGVCEAIAWLERLDGRAQRDRAGSAEMRRVRLTG